jgi:hypothetical protein
MSGAEPPLEAYGDVQALSALGDALDQLGARSVRVLVEAAILLRAFPRWAIWLPPTGGTWTAARSADSRPPGPEIPMIWVTAGTASELADRLRTIDSQLPLPGH